MGGVGDFPLHWYHGVKDQPEEIIHVSVGCENDAAMHRLLLRKVTVVSGHVSAEGLRHGLKILDQEIPPAMGYASFGVRLVLLNQDQKYVDEGLKSEQGHYRGSLLDRRREGVDVNVSYRRCDHVGEALAGIGNEPDYVGNFTCQLRANKKNTSQDKHRHCPCFLPHPDLPLRGVRGHGARFGAVGVLHAVERACYSPHSGSPLRASEGSPPGCHHLFAGY